MYKSLMVKHFRLAGEKEQLAGSNQQYIELYGKFVMTLQQ